MDFHHIVYEKRERDYNTNCRSFVYDGKVTFENVHWCCLWLNKVIPICIYLPSRIRVYSEI